MHRAGSCGFTKAMAGGGRPEVLRLSQGITGALRGRWRIGTFFAGGAALGNSAGAELERTTQRPPSAVHSIDMPPKLSGATASSAERPTPKVSTLPVPPAAAPAPMSVSLAFPDTKLGS